jgi:hypothetical protein
MASPAAANQLRRANTYNFVSQSGETKITYYPVAPGPPRNRPRGPLFEYAGPEGQLRFENAQIIEQAILSGQLLSVALKHESEAGSLAFSLFLAPVNVGDNGSETFTTYGVRTSRVGSLEEPGPQVAYQMETFSGEAKWQFMPHVLGPSGA